jgi:hypothetical protein
MPLGRTQGNVSAADTFYAAAWCGAGSVTSTQAVAAPAPHAAPRPPIGPFAPVKPYSLWWLFHYESRPIFGGMGSYPRREKAEQKARERADTVPVLDCQSCGALTPGERFRYYADQVVCEACDERNPQSRRRLVPRALLQPRTILVNFVEGRALAAQAMALDHRTMLGPQLRIQSAATLRRLLSYLGATPEELSSSTAATGDGVRAPSRSHSSRAARTCSGSIIHCCDMALSDVSGCICDSCVGLRPPLLPSHALRSHTAQRGAMWRVSTLGLSGHWSAALGSATAARNRCGHHQTASIYAAVAEQT